MASQNISIFYFFGKKHSIGGGEMDLSFKRNLGNLDRIIRVLVGVLLLGIAPLLLNNVWSVVFVVVGIFMLVEAILGY